MLSMKDLVFKKQMVKKLVDQYVNIEKSRLSFSLFSFSFLFLFSIFLFLELRVRIRHANTRRR